MSTINTSGIDPSKPADQVPAAKADLRANLGAIKTQLGNAKADIEGLESGKAPASGGGIVEAIAGHIVSPANKTYVLDQAAAFGYQINTLVIKAAAGTCTAAVRIDGTTVTGLGALAVSASEASGTASGANSVAPGATVTLVLSAVAGAADVAFTLKATRT